VSRALAKMSLKKEDCTADLSDCTEKELASLAEWEAKFKDKYAVVGQVSRPGWAPKPESKLGMHGCPATTHMLGLSYYYYIL
jgi:hypothetical protein